MRDLPSRSALRWYNKIMFSYDFGHARFWQRRRTFASRFGATVAFSLLLLGFSFGPIVQAEPCGRSFPIPTGSQPISITEGSDGNLWFTLQNIS
jgi:hypothetical protein